MEAALARSIAAGARAETEIKTAAWGKIVTIADPFGHGLCLIEFLGRGYGEIARPAAPAAVSEGRGTALHQSGLRRAPPANTKPPAYVDTPDGQGSPHIGRSSGPRLSNDAIG